MKVFLYLCLFSISVFFTAQAQPADVQELIDEEEITSLLTELSSDAMMGRKAFTPYIEKAADVISRQFDEAGLEPLSGERDYFQRFSLFTLHPGKSSLTLNGKKLSPASYFVSSHQREINWQDLSGITRKRIGKEDDFRSSFTSISTAPDEQTLVLVASAHKAVFELYANYFSGPVVTMKSNEAPSLLFILTDEDQVKSGSFHLSRTAKKQEAYNVAGQITGTSKKDEYVIFSAHYDHIGVLEPVDGDSIANGADDNASGTTAVIMLAKYFSNRPPPERTLIFVAFTAEEMGGYGSRYFSRQLNPDDVAAMFNIEMIGKPSRFGPNTAYLTGFDKSTMGKILQADLRNTPYRIYPDPYPEQNLFYRSDNATLARLGVPAHTISSVQIDKDTYYHTVGDELETLNIKHLANMIRAIALSSESIVSGSATPTRVDPASLN